MQWRGDRLRSVSGLWMTKYGAAHVPAGTLVLSGASDRRACRLNRDGTVTRLFNSTQSPSETVASMHERLISLPLKSAFWYF